MPAGAGDRERIAALADALTGWSTLRCRLTHDGGGWNVGAFWRRRRSNRALRGASRGTNLKRSRMLSPSPARAALAALLAAIVVAPAVDDAAAARRRSGERDQPPPNYDYDASASSCAPAYAATLRTLFTRPTPQPLATAKMVRTPMPDVGPRWIFHAEGDRGRQRDDMGRLVEGDRVCAEEQSRGGRTRCARWEQRQVSTEPVVPVPPPTRDEARIIGAVAEMVSHKGAPPEFLGNGRYTIMTERVATDLEAYALQEPHPAMCSGAVELVDFLGEKLAPLKKRMGDVEALRGRSLAVVAPRVAALVAALSKPAPGAPPATSDGAAPPLGAPGTTAGTTVEPAPTVLASASAPGPLAAAPDRSAPDTPAGWLAEVATLVLSPADAKLVSGEATPLAGLRRMAVLLATGRSPAPAAARAEAKAALRAIEAAAYVDLLSRRYRDLDRALFGSLDDVRKAHAAQCTCGG